MPSNKLKGQQISEVYEGYLDAQQRMDEVKAAGFGVYISIMGGDGRISLFIVDYKRLGWDSLPKRRVK